ncbi:MAG: DUF4375 domain-containing protein [Bacteroidota bacterium]
MTQPRQDYFQDFNKAKHFRGKVKWDEIKDLTGSDFLWEILEPISEMIKDAKYEETRAKRLSPNQKALHFFWYLDEQVTNGGFIQFYWNGYELYLPSIKQGLKLIGYKDLLKRVIQSETEYDKHIDEFAKWRKKGDWEWLYDNLKEFEKLDDWYYSKEEKHYSIVEKFVRQNIDDFIIKIK